MALAARSTAFAGSVSLSRQPRRAAVSRGAAPPPRAGIFDFLQPKEAAPVSASLAYICIDCGYIYKGDINKENFFYKCPVCDVGKNRFKKKEASGGAALNNLAAAKAAAKKAKAAAPPTVRPRDLLKQKLMDSYKDPKKK